MGTKLVWTTTPPTEPGWYWARGIFRVTIDKLEEFVGIVEINNYDGYISVCLPGTEIERETSDYTHWIGPLEKPLPPTNME